MTKPRVILEIGIGPILVIAGLIFVLTTFGHCEEKKKKELKVPVTIHIEHIDKDKVYFEPMVAPMFEGRILGISKETSADHVMSCYATSEPVATTTGGAEVENLVLVCGTVKIYLETVDFR